MASKYPTLAFTARDCQELYEHLKGEIDGLTVTVRLSPTKTDPYRLQVCLSGFVRQVRLGEKPRRERILYIPGDKPGSIDKTIFQGLWALSEEIECPPDLWGTYTELVPGFLPRT